MGGKHNAPPPAYNTAPWQQGGTPNGGLTGADKNNYEWLNGGKQAPNPVDFYGAAGAQGASGQANIAGQTLANRPDQNNAFGSSVGWSQGPDGRWTQSQQFGGGLGQAAQGLEGQIAGMGQPMDWSKISGLDSGAQARDQAIQGAYGQATSRLDPMWDQREKSQQTSLLNQGLDPNSTAYQNAMSQFGRDRNDAYSSAMNGAIGQGTQAGQALFGQSLAGRQQGISEMLQQRNAPMQELQGLQGFLSQPGFSQAGAAGATPWLSAAQYLGNYGLGQASQANSNAGSVMGGLGQLAGGVASFIP